MILLMGVIPMPPARNTAGFELSRCKVNEPIGALTLTFVPIGIARKALLNAVSRIRVATIKEP